MKLWVDDLRPAPEGWTWAKTSEVAITALALFMGTEKTITELSLDHDLGEDDTTLPVVDWMAEHDLWPAIVRVHSMNPVGVANLTRTINRYGPGVTR